MREAVRKRERIGGIVILIAGFLVAVYGTPEVLLARKSGNWPTVPGTVVSSDVDSSHVGRGRLKYWPEVEYEYLVDGELFEGDRISHAQVRLIGTYLGGATQTADHYRVGREVKVAYDPDNPASSVLEPGFDSKLLAVLIFGSVMMLCGVIMLVHTRKRRV